MQISKLKQILNSSENEHLEVKEAKTSFGPNDLVKYCVALANEGGGLMVLGVTDQIPREIVGSQAFLDLEKIKLQLFDSLHLRVGVEELFDSGQRVLVFRVPSRPIGVPIAYKGAYWMRAGGSLVLMTQDRLKSIFEETVPDFSAEVCPKATITDLAPEALENFRSRWHRKTKRDSILQLSSKQLLTDTELITDEGMTFAALILFGSHQSLGRFLPNAEVVFEYRSKESSGPAQNRLDFREGLFLFEEKLTETIDLRNDVQHFREGLFVWGIPTFNETVIRESVLNAICHRDYRLGRSVFIRQFPKRMEIESPGGFLPGINPENVIDQHAHRNRRIAETLQRCGLVERSGQGMNLIFEKCIKESKDLPDFSGTDDFRVFLTLQGEINDPQFLRFLEKVGEDTLSSFSTKDLLLLDIIRRDGKILADYQNRLPRLLDSGVIERASRGGYLLSRSFYASIEKKGIYTRKKGLDRETNKALLLKHIQENKKEGSPLRDLIQVLPALSKSKVQNLLRELKAEKKIQAEGKTRAGRWHPVQLF